METQRTVEAGRKKKMEDRAREIIEELKEHGADGDVVQGVADLIAHLALEVEQFIPSHEKGRFEAYILPVLLQRSNPEADWQGRWAGDMNPSLTEIAEEMEQFDGDDDYDEDGEYEGGAA